MPPSPTPPKRPPHWLLRHCEQAVVAVFLAAGLVSLIGWWAYHGGARGRLVEIERTGRQHASFVVDVNAAAWPELADLPGVGRNLAERIVKSRVENGPYADIEELRRVRGIGPRTMESMRPYLRPIPKRTAVAGP